VNTERLLRVALARIIFSNLIKRSRPTTRCSPKLRGKLDFIYEGEIYNIYDIYGYWGTDIDFGILLLNEFWKSNNAACAEIFLPLLKLRQERARLFGFDNFYDYFYSDKNILGYGKEETFAFDQYIKKYISLIYAEIKANYAQELGFEILPYDYDLTRKYSDVYTVKQELLDDEINISTQFLTL
jgi:hypothetical protein